MGKLKAYLDNIAFSHSIFALPFAYIGAILAAGKVPSGHDVFWITVAMVGARSAALAINNLIDLRYDRLQPRFAARPMVTGAIRSGEAVIFIAASLGVFWLAASHLHPLSVRLLPLAVVFFIIYPYGKRFSWACHFILGLALACAPIGAWVGIRGEIGLVAIFLGLAVGLWIAGFDVIYGCQDVAFDKAHRLHSIPVRFGVGKSFIIVRILHGLSIISFVTVGVLEGLGRVFYLGVALAAAVLVYQHAIIRQDCLARANQAYFMRNGLVGIAILLFTLVDLL